MPSTATATPGSVSGGAFGKAFQRRLYSVLLDRSTVLALIVVTGVVTVATLHFGQAWLEWSADKYAAVFNHFSDNLAGRSLQGRLCQYVPVDAVYTWVNGSDPVFLDDLKHAKERLTESKSRVLLEGCPYDHCVPSHLLAAERILPASTRASLLKEQNGNMERLESVVNTRLACGDYVQNRTLLHFAGPSDAQRAHNLSRDVKIGFESHPVHLAYWTTDWTVPNSFPMPGFFMVTDLPSTATEAKVKHVLPAEISRQLESVWIEDAPGNVKLAVLKGRNATLTKAFLESSPAVDLGGGNAVRVTAANLIVKLPKYADDETHAPNRYADYEQLRYSLRSLEKYAPWVRQVFIVTNGQIPYWLNLDHPKVTVVTHEEIFEDDDYLPTFSSPAIETNLHRIPGLSDKFLYLNDDVMLGRPIWPEDFYSEHDGFKIRLSWPLPDCNKGCPSTWIKDGYCDKACNVSACIFDGGDCLGPNPRMGFGDQDDDHAFNWQNQNWNGDRGDGGGEEKPECSENCLDSWLADGFCDETCNVEECGFDSGDCGVFGFRSLHQVAFNYRPEDVAFDFELPAGTTVAFWNMSAVYDKYDEVGLENPVVHDAVRSISLSDTHKVMVIVLYPDVDKAQLDMTLQAKRNGSIVSHKFSVAANTTGHVRPKSELGGLVMPEIKDPASVDHVLPLDIEQAVGDSGDFKVDVDLSAVNVSLLNLTEEDHKHLAVLKRQLDDEELTEKGYRVKKEKVIKSHVRRYVARGGRLEDLTDNPTHSETDVRPIQEAAKGVSTSTSTTSTTSATQIKLAASSLSPASPNQTSAGKSAHRSGKQSKSGKTSKAAKADRQPLDSPSLKKSTSLGMLNATLTANQRKIFWSRIDETAAEANALVRNVDIVPPAVGGGPQRRLLDAYGDSLLHVNRLYSEQYGHAHRKAPAHIPHLIDRAVMEDLQAAFPAEWRRTAQHVFREGDDMQYSFAYFHFIMNERKRFSAAEVFAEFDTDGSRTWSDREIRTLLARMHSLPLYLETVRGFEAMISNCSLHLPPQPDIPVPPYERYYDSKLPVVTLGLIAQCPAVLQELAARFRDRRRFKHVIVSDEDVSFKTLTSNVSHVVRQLDDLRRSPVKFVCINDDTDPNRLTDNALVQSVLVDFFESMLPAPSAFELPPEYRNKFSRVSELARWRFYRTMLRAVTTISFIGLVVLSLSSYFNLNLVGLARRAAGAAMPWLFRAPEAKKAAGYSV